MRAVHFGAGNIGRGFIGLILSRAGYEVCFVDVNEELVSQLRERGSYKVVLADGTGHAEQVTGVTAINGADLELVAQHVAEADLVTTAVGVNILKHIAAGIAEGIARRVKQSKSSLHIIACENAIGGSSRLKEHVYGLLDEATRQQADRIVAFPDAAVDRIVPIQHHQDPLEVTVEPFYEWVVDRSAVLEGYHKIEGVHYVDRLEPYIERKLFTVNTGHCCAAYAGYLRGYDTIQQAMADQSIAGEVRLVLEETGAVLVRRYGFDKQEHEQYIGKILERFRNPHLTDETVRVARSPIRKLSPEDRLVRPALQAVELGLEPIQLVKAMASALHFDYQDDPEALELQETIQTQGIKQAITRYTGIEAGQPLFALILDNYHHLNKGAH
ncbi:mannitol-1-phosphate 5-dehydrogenase [Paenibacillus sp. GCM10012307]|uniref:Mannitol-1-phosphate 5-dehydrogenase n=1 Tax=Paenibacillus roseus TaxID=2798579 RepID=A0A934J342_9BACL|nr:mannitol-1-phosphate 5-dehydrogenase [Paenibacillus roseus]MBJ6363887.1 mannitol-1-phosphate 5-dehydrogenase [Paenibacillus roseus]